MEFLIYSSKLSDEALLQNNIFISPEADISEGVKLYFGVKVYGQSSISSDVELHSNTEICNSTIGGGCKIYSSIISSSNIEQNCVIKPFTHIQDCEFLSGCVIGNFTSASKSVLGLNSNIGPLCCLKNVEAGNNLRVQSGACCEVEEGSINIGDNVTIGVNATIIKSVIISDNAKIDANSIITKDVDVGQVATNGIKQINKALRG